MAQWLSALDTPEWGAAQLKLLLQILGLCRAEELPLLPSSVLTNALAAATGSGDAQLAAQCTSRLVTLRPGLLSEVGKFEIELPLRYADACQHLATKGIDLSLLNVQLNNESACTEVVVTVRRLTPFMDSLCRSSDLGVLNMLCPATHPETFNTAVTLASKDARFVFLLTPIELVELLLASSDSDGAYWAAVHALLRERLSRDTFSRPSLLPQGFSNAFVPCKTYAGRAEHFRYGCWRNGTLGYVPDPGELLARSRPPPPPSRNAEPPVTRSAAPKPPPPQPKPPLAQPKLPPAQPKPQTKKSPPPLPATLTDDFHECLQDMGHRHGYEFGVLPDGRVGYGFSQAKYIDDDYQVQQTHHVRIQAALQSQNLAKLRAALDALQQHCKGRTRCSFCATAGHAPQACLSPYDDWFVRGVRSFWYDLFWKCATSWGSVSALEASVAANAACGEVAAYWLNLAMPSVGGEPKLYMLKAAMKGKHWDMVAHMVKAILSRRDSDVSVSDFGEDEPESAIPQLLVSALHQNAPAAVSAALWSLVTKFKAAADRVLYGVAQRRSVGDPPIHGSPFLLHAIAADNADAVTFALEQLYPRRSQGWDALPGPLYPLMEAATSRRLNAAGALLRCGLKPHIAGLSSSLGTPLGLAALTVPPSWALCATMLQGKKAETALDFATPVPSWQRAKGALSDVPLHLAAHANQAPLVDAVLAALNDSQRRTVLTAIDTAGNTVLHCALLGKPSGQIAASLIRASAPMWVRNAAGQTALSLALSAFGAGSDTYGVTVLAAMQTAWASHVASLAKEPNGSQAACSFLPTLALAENAAQCWPKERAWLCERRGELLSPLLRRQDVAAAAVAAALSAPPAVRTRLLPMLLDEPEIPAAAVPLWLAAAAVSPAEFRRLIARGPRVDAADAKTGDTALHAAARTGSLDMIAALLEARARVAVSNRVGDTPLHCAARAGAPDVVRALLDAGADAAALNDARDSSLHCAARDVAGRESRLALCRTLARCAPEVLKVTNTAGQTPVQAAASKETKTLIQEEAHAAHRERTAGKAKPVTPAKAAKPVAASATTESAAEQPAAAGDGEEPLALPPPLPPPPRCELDEVAGESDADLRSRVRGTLDKLPELMAVSAAAPIAAAATPAAPADGDAAPLTSQLRAGAEATLGPLLPLESAAERAAADAAANAAVAALNSEDAAAAEEARAHVPASVAELSVALSQSVWQFSICSGARKEWAGMDAPFRAMVVAKMLGLGAGFWRSDGTCSQLVPDDVALKKTLELWRCKFSKAGRILFEVAPDWSSRSRCFQDMIRVWCITLDHDRYERERVRVEASHRRAQTSREKPALRRLSAAPLRPDGQRLPQSYEEREQRGEDASAEAPDAAPASQRELRQHLPPASSSADTFTLLKFFDMSGELMHACLTGQDETRVDFPFRVSQPEMDIITHEATPPAAMLLIGRSGTGKTTCAVYRLWARWLLARQAGVPLTAVFITASATLRTQVAASFRRLRAATFSVADAAAVAEAEAVPLTHLLAVPDWRWPLFLTSAEYLKLVDASLPAPFLAAPSSADAGEEDDGLDLDLDGAALEIDLLSGGGAESDSDDDNLDASASAAPVAQRRCVRVMDIAAGLRIADHAIHSAPARDARKEVTYTFFVNTLWKRITTKEQRAALRPALVYQEIRSYLAGSADALAHPDHRLPLAAYLEIGRKRAPNFSEDGRRALYPIFVAYERIKSKLGRYDVCDLVASIYARLEQHGWRGTPLRALLRDEVQDFTQAELLLDMRLLEDPSGILLCGDSAQTIARGVGFRFADIRTLFFDESQRRKALGLSGPPLAVPRINCLELNYRTHTGVLDAAAVCVACLRLLFPLTVDALPRERAFFDGQRPLLLPTLSETDLSILLSGADRNASTVEFGAHQVILVRSTEAAARLPLALRTSALVMTVPQAKGLEFDDVFVVRACPMHIAASPSRADMRTLSILHSQVDFFEDSPCHDEWRVLLSLQEELRAEEHGLMRNSGDTMPELGEEDAEAVRSGALRPLPFDPVQHVVLGEELKHLYTAITRAKSNVIFSDRSPKLRAPFYRLLRSLGLARAVRESLLADGTHHGLSRVRSGPAEWAARARNLLDNEQPGVAADCFARAGDAPRSLAARGMAVAAQAAALEAGREARALQLRAADHLLRAAAFAPKADEAAVAVSVAAAATAAATRAAAEEAAADGDAPVESVVCSACIMPATDAERTSWLGRAAAAFVRAEEWGAASELYLMLKRYARAGTCLLRMGQPRRAAEVFERGAEAATGDAVVELQLRALRAHLTARANAAALALLQRNPALARAAADAKVDVSKVATEVATAAHAAGRRVDALAALRHVATRALRDKLLRAFGYWAELAEGMPDAVAGADMLLQHAGPGPAAARLRAALPANPGLAPRLHTLLLCAASREEERSAGAKLAASAAALWTSASGLPWADATFQAGRLGGNAASLHGALAAYREASRPLAQLAAMAALAKLPGAELSTGECTAALPAVRVACRAMGVLANRASDSFAIAQLDALYGGLGLASGVAALAKSSSATVALPADEWQLSACITRVAASHPSAAMTAAKEACAVRAAPPGKPLPPRSVLWRAALSAVLLDLHDDCVAVVTAVAQSHIVAAEKLAQAGDGAGAVNAALTALQTRQLREQVQTDVGNAGRSHVMALPPAALPFGPAALAASMEMRRSATLALCRVLFPPAEPGGVDLAALDAFSAAFATEDDNPRKMACAAVFQECEASYDLALPPDRAGADGGACVAALWRVFALAAPARVEVLRRRVRSARDAAKRAAGTMRSMQLAGVAAPPPPLTVRAEPFSSPLALLLAARDAAQSRDPAFAAHALLHFVDFERRFAPGAAQDAHRALIELAAGAALSALGVMQVAVVPAGWLHAYGRLAGAGPPPKAPVEAALAEQAVKAAAAALARALRLSLTMPGGAAPLSLAPLCVLLSAALPESPAQSQDLAPLEHIAWAHVASLCDSPNASVAEAAKTAAARADSKASSCRDVVIALLSLARAVTAPTELRLLRLMPNWTAIPFDGVARHAKGNAAERTYAAPSRAGRASKAAARLMEPLTDDELVLYGENLDPLAPTEAQQAAASTIQRCWRARCSARAAAALAARRAAALSAAATALASDRYRHGAAAALRRWTAQVRDSLRVRRTAAAEEELARARMADLAASLADRLRSLAAAAAAPENTATCPVCPRASTAAAAPVAATGLRAFAAEFVPLTSHGAFPLWISRHACTDQRYIHPATHQCLAPSTWPQPLRSPHTRLRIWTPRAPR